MEWERRRNRMHCHTVLSQLYLDQAEAFAAGDTDTAWRLAGKIGVWLAVMEWDERQHDSGYGRGGAVHTG